MKKMKHN